MTTFSFEAKCVVTEHPEGDCHFVGFADRKHGTHRYLILQRDFEHDEQDVKLGMDTFHVEWCSEDMSGYGGITAFLLGPSSAEVTFDDETTEALDGVQHLSIAFDLGASERNALVNALGHIFQGTGCLGVAES